jgi:DNA-binding NtrC family response regulator
MGNVSEMEKRMSGRRTEIIEPARGGTSPERIKLLLIPLKGAHELGSVLETALLPVQNLEVVRAVLPDENSAPTVLPLLIAKAQPNLLLVCSDGGELEGNTDKVFDVIRRNLPELLILVVLEQAKPHVLQRLVNMGATDFCLAPVRLDDLVPRIMRWSAYSISRSGDLARHLERNFGLKKFLGESPLFLKAIQQISKLAKFDANVLITGETGTGKELCARAVHHLGPRADHPFVPVNCGAIPSELVENELFGHDSGAFTSATTAIRGLVHDAEGGTLFLDEIDCLPLKTQVKFLRFLQDQEYRPLGSRKTCRANVRIIAASNADLEGIVGAGKFRSDLFYRLNVLPLKLPALRERREDIPILARHFAAKFAKEFSTKAKELSDSALEKLMAYEWPGNVRELENIIERAVILSERALIMSDDICVPTRESPAGPTSFKALKAHAVAEFEATYIRRLLASNDGNISKAARAAQKDRRAFWQLMRKHGIVVPMHAVD